MLIWERERRFIADMVVGSSLQVSSRTAGAPGEVHHGHHPTFFDSDSQVTETKPNPKPNPNTNPNLTLTLLTLTLLTLLNPTIWWCVWCWVVNFSRSAHPALVFACNEKSAAQTDPLWSGTWTFRAQDLSFPRTNSPYGDLSFPRLFVNENESERKFQERSFLGPFVLGNFHSLDLSFRGTFVPRTFRSQELSFLRLFYKALAMNADSYSNCQNLFRSIT